MAKQEIFDEALKLSPEARAELAHELLVSLDTEETDSDSEWVHEIERRAREVLDGTAQTVPLDQVCARVSERLRQRKKR